MRVLPWHLPYKWGKSTEVFPCFFLSCKANARVKLAKTGDGPHSSTLVVLCVVRLLFVLFCVLFVCKCVLPPGDKPIAVNKYININNCIKMHGLTNVKYVFHVYSWSRFTDIGAESHPVQRKWPKLPLLNEFFFFACFHACSTPYHFLLHCAPNTGRSVMYCCVVTTPLHCTAMSHLGPNLVLCSSTRT
jgi:hypothetical protein